MAWTAGTPLAMPARGPYTVSCYLMQRLLQSPTRLLLGLACVLGCTGCVDYNRRTHDALTSFESGQFDRAIDAYAERNVTKSKFLRGAEAGMVALAAGDWQRAIRYLGDAASEVEEVEREALISGERAAEDIGAWLFNEGAANYTGEGYERVTLHAGLALAYLASGQVSDMMVEVRRADALLVSEEEFYDKRYGAGGLAHFLSAVGYELMGQSDDAYIDYKRLEEKGLGSELTGRSLERLARALDRDEHQLWLETYGPGTPLPEGAASIVVIAGVGYGPYKAESTLDIPTHDGLFQMSVPGYFQRQQPISSLELDAGHGHPVETVIIEDVARVASENLEDRLGWIAIRSGLRGAVKLGMTDALEDEHGVGGRLAGDLFMFLTERADLRAWRTLPDTWQAGRLWVQPGEHQLRLSALGGESRVLGVYDLQPGETMFVVARTLGSRLFAYPVGGTPVAPPGVEEKP